MPCTIFCLLKKLKKQGELLLRCEELRDALWTICDTRYDDAGAVLQRSADDGAVMDHLALLGVHAAAAVQVELDRCAAGRLPSTRQHDSWDWCKHTQLSPPSQAQATFSATCCAWTVNSQ
jgi:hypothetical protein